MHALVGGQPEVVVGAEHDPLGALHLDHRRGRRLERGGSRGAGRPRAPPAAARRARGRGPSRRRRWRSACRVPVCVSRWSCSPVASRRDRREFIELPYRLHSSSAVWVPPLRLERRLFLNRAPERVLQARRRAAVPRPPRRPRGRPHQRPVRRRLQRASTTTAGGCSASSSSRTTPRSCRRCSRRPAAWLRAHGRDHMIGPMDFTMNDESGVMIEGFEREPMIKQPWHPPYYQQRCEEAGLSKAMDLFMWELEISDRDADAADHLQARRAARAAPRHHDPPQDARRSLRKDMDRFAEVYNSAWSENWGFSPYSQEATSTPTRRRCSSSSTRNWFMVAETTEGETAAVAITVPDINQVLKKMNGRLLPLGWWHFLRKAQDDRPRARRLPRRQAGLPAHGRRGRALRRALRHGRRARRRSGARWAGSSRPTRT